MNCSLVSPYQESHRNLPKAKKYPLSNFSKHVGRSMNAPFLRLISSFFQRSDAGCFLLKLQTFSTGKMAQSKLLVLVVLIEGINRFCLTQFETQTLCRPTDDTETVNGWMRCQSVSHLTPSLCSIHWFTETERQQWCLHIYKIPPLSISAISPVIFPAVTHTTYRHILHAWEQQFITAESDRMWTGKVRVLECIYHVMWEV